VYVFGLVKGAGELTDFFAPVFRLLKKTILQLRTNRNGITRKAKI